MSSYKKETKHPISGHWETADWLDDYFGSHLYGVRFPSTGEVFPETSFEWETRENQHEYSPEKERDQVRKLRPMSLSEENINAKIVLAFLEKLEVLTPEERGTILKSIQIMNHPIYVI